MRSSADCVSAGLAMLPKRVRKANVTSSNSALTADPAAPSRLAAAVGMSLAACASAPSSFLTASLSLSMLLNGSLCWTSST
jgi:hypothetical protein